MCNPSQTNPVRILLWHTRDLRLHDHPVLTGAETREVLPVYCLDTALFKFLSYDGVTFSKMGPLRLHFLVETLEQLRASYRKQGGDLLILQGDTIEQIQPLIDRYQIEEVWTEVAVTSEEQRLQQRLSDAVNVSLHAFRANTLLNPKQLPFPEGHCPKSFTSFRKKVEKKGEAFPEGQTHFPENLSLISLQDESIEPSQLVAKMASVFEDTTASAASSVDGRTAFPFEGGEVAALEHLEHYLWKTQNIARYKETRNGLIGAEYSSKFSPWLALGSLSAAHTYREIRRFEAEVTENKSTYWLIFELLWRDFFWLVARKNGNAIFKQGGIQQRDMHYANPKGAFLSWIEGRTDDEFVNACMNELRLTGYLSNRGRQNAASYLCHDLDVDWRWGAAWFEHCLLDYDPHSNWGNWMYIAGVGNGGQNRRFNTQSQAEHYDKNGEFQQLWRKG